MFKDSNGDIQQIKLLIPAGNIAALIEVENGVYEELEKKQKLVKKVEKELDPKQVIKLKINKENKSEKDK